MIKEDVILWILLSDALLLSNREFYCGTANSGFICTCDMHSENSQDQSWLRSPSTSLQFHVGASVHKIQRSRVRFSSGKLFFFLVRVPAYLVNRRSNLAFTNSSRSISSPMFQGLE